MHLRRNNKTRSEVSFDEPLNTDWDGNELLLSDVLGMESDVIRYIEEAVDRDILFQALSCLPPRERRIMELRFGLKDGRERTQKEVADELGISQSYISRLEKRILKKLRAEMHRMTVACSARPPSAAGAAQQGRNVQIVRGEAADFQLVGDAAPADLLPPAPLEARSDDRHPDLVFQALVDDGAEDDVG